MSTSEELFVTGFDENHIHLRAPDGRTLSLKKAELTPSQNNAFEIAVESRAKNTSGTALAPIVLHVTVKRAPDGQYQSIQITSIEVRNN